MATSRPPLTDDPALNAWMNEVTNNLISAVRVENVMGRLSATSNLVNSATLELFQRTLTSTPPALADNGEPVDRALRYNYTTGEITDPDSTDLVWNSWQQVEPEVGDGGPYLWRVVVHVASTTNTDTIQPDTWSDPLLVAVATEGFPTPSAATDLSQSRTDQDSAVLMWTINAADAGQPGLFSVIEVQESGEDTWTEIGTVPSPSNAYNLTGLSGVEQTQSYRVIIRNINGLSSPASDTVMVTPPTPNAPTGLTFSKDSEDVGTLSWSYTAGVAQARYFVIEVRQTGQEFSGFSLVNATDTTAKITGLSTEGRSLTYRIKTVSVSGTESNYSNELEVDPSPVQPPSDFTVTPVERVGLQTIARLSWSLPDDGFNIIRDFVVQFRSVQTPPAAWRDIVAIDGDNSTADSLPPEQGNVEYRIRATAINGNPSVFVESGTVFISGGSITDAATYGGDGAFISQRHYSINGDDQEITGAAVIDEVEGGTIDVDNNRIEGIDGQSLSFSWVVSVPTNSVTRQRHYYLNLDNVVAVGDSPPIWDVDTGNVTIEVLNDPALTAGMYSGTDVIDPDTDFVFTDADGADNTNTRTYDERVSGSHMYATRSSIRLPMTRTFTFREDGSAMLNIRFASSPAAHPRVDFTDGNRIRLEAFSTERLETRTETGVTSAGKAITYNEDFEATPMVFLTPDSDTNTWVTNKTSTGCTIHSSSSSTVDTTIRGY